jgi:hypothetical protein
MALTEDHKQKLATKYGFAEDRIKYWEERNALSSLSPEQVCAHLGRTDIISSGILIRYPENGASAVRLDEPFKGKDGNDRKYLRGSGTYNHVFNPGLDLDQSKELWITEGELKALCGFDHDLPIVALSGIWCWKTSGSNGEKLSDEEGLLPDLARVQWSGKKVVLFYDSDITPGHKAYDAFPRLAEQLYRLGADEVKIISLPPLEKDQKTGLDDFILARKEQAIPELNELINTKKPYISVKQRSEAALKKIHELGELAEKSKKDRDFDTGLPFEGHIVEALAIVKMDNSAEFSRIWTKLKEAKPKPDIRLLESKVKTKVKVQNSSQKATFTDSTSHSLDPIYEIPSRLLNEVTKEYQINPTGGLSKIEFCSTMDENGKMILKPRETPICDFVPWPVREILKDNGSNPVRYIELEGILPDSSRLGKVTVSMGDFQEMKWPSLVWGPKAAVRPYQKEDLRFCIQKMSQNSIPKSTVYTHLGWRKIDGHWIYLHAGGAVGADNVEIDLPVKLSRYKLPKNVEDKKKAIQTAVSLLEIGSSEIMYPLVAIAFLSPLMEVMRQAGIEPGLLMYLWGKSGCLKSTLIALILCLFGTFEPKGLPASFRDTPKSIEELAFVTKDSLLPVDDLYPAQDPRDRQKMIGVLEYLMRNQGDRQGRGRLDSNSSLKDVHPPRGLAVASGEMQPLSGSSLARAFTLQINKSSIDLEKLTKAQAEKDQLSQVMVCYLEWLSHQFDELPKTLPDEFDRLRNKSRTETKIPGRHGRLDDSIAVLYIGLSKFIDFSVAVESLTREEGNVILENGWKIFNEIADKQTEMARRGDPVQIFLEATLELMAQNKIYFIPMDAKPKDVWNQEIIPKQRELIGFGPDEAGVYYILMGPAVNAVNGLLRGQGDGKSIDKSILLDALEQKELLATPLGKQNSFPKTIHGKTQWVTAVKEQAFNLDWKAEAKS